ncbi:RDD family protein [Pseudomarimonas arenosa]|uniref:RDD family protein n=1 Tax=Pseudomarimonas arenosa TaxID=2774145 RepID=A0AAW3ZHJ6_9GAMM|nr:RDD family protein [Pseudomarimonas arenosa]MBD8525496.1 RDD family protein [Pseudomarimonas arenosa]
MSTPPPLPEHNPYAAPQARVDDGFGEELVLADRGIRLVAAIIDGLAFGGVAILAAILIPMLAPREGQGGSEVAVGILGFVMVAAFLAVVVVNCLWLHRYGQTIGKRVMSIKILRGDGSPISLGRVIGMRWLPVTLLGMIPIVGYIVTLVDPLLIFREDRRCMHDMIADSIVVKC